MNSLEQRTNWAITNFYYMHKAQLDEFGVFSSYYLHAGFPPYDVASARFSQVFAQRFMQSNLFRLAQVDQALLSAAHGDNFITEQLPTRLAFQTEIYRSYARQFSVPSASVQEKAVEGIVE